MTLQLLFLKFLKVTINFFDELKNTHVLMKQKKSINTFPSTHITRFPLRVPCSNSIICFLSDKFTVHLATNSLFIDILLRNDQIEVELFAKIGFRKV